MIMDTNVLPDLCDRLAALGASEEEVRGFEYLSEGEQTAIVVADVDRQMDAHLQILFACLWTFTCDESDELNGCDEPTQSHYANLESARDGG